MGQDYIDLLKVDYLQMPKSTLFGSTENEEQTLSIYAVDATLPIPLSSKVVLLTGLATEQLNAPSFTQSDPRGAWHFMPKLGAKIQLNDRWDVVSVFLPQWSSSFSQPKTTGYQFGNVTLFSRQTKSGAKWRYGAFFNQALFGSFFSPLIGYYRETPDQKWEFNILLPSRGTIGYRVAFFLQTGLGFDSTVRAYAIDNERYLERLDNFMFAFTQFEFLKNGVFTLRAGHTFSRKYASAPFGDQLDMAFPLLRFDNRSDAETLVDSDGWFFQCRLAYRFQTK